MKQGGRAVEGAIKWGEGERGGGGKVGCGVRSRGWGASAVWRMGYGAERE